MFYSTSLNWNFMKVRGFQSVYQFVVWLFYLSAKQYVLHHSSADSKANLHFRFLHNFEWRRTVWIPRFPQSYYIGLDTCEFTCMQVSDWDCRKLINLMSRFWVWNYLSVIPKCYSKGWTFWGESGWLGWGTWVGEPLKTLWNVLLGMCVYMIFTPCNMLFWLIWTCVNFFTSGHVHKLFFWCKYTCRMYFFSKSHTPHQKSNGPP